MTKILMIVQAALQKLIIELIIPQMGSAFVK